MKDDVHKDKLEEFLRKSLEGHSEEPPGDLWSKIAVNLDTPVATVPTAAPKLRLLRSWWSAAAAAAVVTGLLIGQHFYLSGKIEHLNRALEQNAAQLKELEEKKVTGQETLPIDEATENETTPENVTTTESELPGNATQNAAQQGQSAKQAKPASSPINQVSNEKKQLNGTDGTTPPTSIANAQNELKSAGNTAESTAQAKETKQAQEEKATPPTEEAVVTKQDDMTRTWERKLMPIEQPELSAPTIATIIPASLKQGKRFTVGLQAMPMLTKPKIKRVDREVEGGPFPGGPPDKDKWFNASKENSYNAWAAGGVVELHATPRLHFGTGLSYRSLGIESTHEICLNYGDGKPKPGPHEERQYEYELNTATGSVPILLSAASTVSSSNLNDTTKLEATIKTSEHLAFASVPFYANYSFGNGRLRVLAKAGIVFNFLLDSKFNLDNIERPSDSKFEFDRPESRHGSHSDLQNLTASYMAGLGFEYQVSKSMSLRAEPTVMGSLTRLHNNPYIESSEISAGLNVGLMYSF